MWKIVKLEEKKRQKKLIKRNELNRSKKRKKNSIIVENIRKLQINFFILKKLEKTNIDAQWHNHKFAH